MQHSATIVNYCNSYRLHPQDVFFAILATHGCSRWEAYGCAFSCLSLKESTLKNRASLLVRSKPGLSKLLADLVTAQVTAPSEAPTWEEYNARVRGGKDKKSRDKNSGSPDITGGWDDEKTAAENVKRIMAEEFPNIHGKDKVDLSFKFAKLIGADVETVDNVHYYLPLRCCNCGLYLRHKENEKPGESGV